MQHYYRRVVLTLAVAFAGGGVLFLIGIPAAWLLGAVLFTGIFSAAGMRTDVPSPLKKAASLILGASIGCSITPDALSLIGEWPISMAGVLITTVIVQMATQLYLRRVAGWDPASSFLSAVPGVTSYVVVVTMSTTADIRKVATAQSVRAFLLVLLLPLLLQQAPALESIATGDQQASAIAVAITIAVAFAGALLFDRLNIPGAWLLGSLFGSALLHFFGGASGRMPDEVMIVGLALLGATIGCRFIGLDRATLIALGLHSLGAFAIGLLITLAAAAAVWNYLSIPFDQLAMGFAPGGIDAMTALAFATGIDVVFVASHQIARFVFIAAIVPVIVRLFMGPPPACDAGKRRL